MNSLTSILEKTPTLSVAIFLPIVFAVTTLFLKFKNPRHYFYYGILSSVPMLFLSLKLLKDFDKTNSSFQFIEKFSLNAQYKISYFLGIDGISLLMIFLMVFLTPICLAISINSISSRVKEFVFAFLLIEGLVIGSFCALDLLLFYFFFEAMLIPMFLVIGIWGGVSRIYASYKFFLFTLVGSLMFLIAIIFIYNKAGTTDITSLFSILPAILKTSPQIEKLLWLAFFISFAIKVPMFPVHSWLPDAHVQAPTAGSVILAGILIKIGAYGFIRFSLPLMPQASIFFSEFVFYLSVIAIIYGSLVALMQEDMKKMIAYSSVAHMGFVTMGIFSFNRQGLDGAIFQMLSHGIVSAALFICVGIIYDRLHTKQIKDLGGIAIKMPNFAMLAMIFVMASVGLPATSGFIGEFLTIIGVFSVNKLIASIASIGVVLGACYMLWLYKRVWFGEIKNPHIQKIEDINKIEFSALFFMAFLVILFGIFPNILIQYFAISSESIVSALKISLECHNKI